MYGLSAVPARDNTRLFLFCDYLPIHSGCGAWPLAFFQLRKGYWLRVEQHSLLVLYRASKPLRPLASVTHYSHYQWTHWRIPGNCGWPLFFRIVVAVTQNIHPFPRCLRVFGRRWSTKRSTFNFKSSSNVQKISSKNNLLERVARLCLTLMASTYPVMVPTSDIYIRAVYPGVYH